MNFEIILPREDEKFLKKLSELNFNLNITENRIKTVITDEKKETEITELLCRFIIDEYERNMILKYIKQLNTLKEIVPSIEYLATTLLNDDVKAKKEDILGREVSEVVKCGKFDICGFANFRCRKYRNVIKETVMDSYVLIISKIISDS